MTERKKYGRTLQVLEESYIAIVKRAKELSKEHGFRVSLKAALADLLKRK